MPEKQNLGLLGSAWVCLELNYSKNSSFSCKIVFLSLGGGDQPLSNDTPELDGEQQWPMGQSRSDFLICERTTPWSTSHLKTPWLQAGRKSQRQRGQDADVCALVGQEQPTSFFKIWRSVHFFLVILHCRCYDVFLNSLKTTHQRSPNLFKPSTVGPCRHQELVHRWCFPAIQLLGVPHIHMAAVGPLLAQKNLAPGCDSQQGFRQCGGRREQRCRLKSRFENHVGKTIINS